MATNKAIDDASLHRHEDVSQEQEPDLKHVATSNKHGDRAAELIGNQHIELTEEDVSAFQEAEPHFNHCRRCITLPSHPEPA
jgi:hypothetical protein